MASKQSPSDNRSQFVSFRVLAYRLRLPDIMFPIGPESREFPINYLLRVDVSDPNYELIAREFEDDASLSNFLDVVYALAVDGLAGGAPALLAKDSIFEVIDMTPLVSNVNITLNLGGENTCSLTMVDHGFTDFGASNVDVAMANGPISTNMTHVGPAQGSTRSEAERHATSNAAATSPKENDRFNALRGFILKEFELIRVEEYVSYDESWQDRSLGFAKNALNSEYTSTTGFTGLVVDITRSVDLSGVPVVNVSCAGMSSVLTRGTAVFDKAIAQVLSLKGGETLKVLDKDINVYANRFMNKSSLEVFLGLVDDYFFIKRRVTQAGNNTTVDDNIRALHMPDIGQESWRERLRFQPENGEARSALVQFMPTLLCYHILKYTNLEPIVTLDDMLNESRSFMDDPGASTRLPMPVVRSRRESLQYLKPYLDMIRTSYQLFDSSYQQPSAVLDEIRSNSFFEIFEDRSGGFHFRFPRYNATTVLHSLEFRDSESVTMKKSDSAVFNVAQCQNMLALVGAMGPRGLSPEIFFDRFSISRFGMRMPQKVENPNAVIPEMAKEIARHISAYNASITSRTATVVRTLDPSINIGEMVRFELGPPDRTSQGPMQSGDGRVFVGYVASIQESIQVSGSARQTLGLVMVRQIGQAAEQELSDTVRLTLRQAAGAIRRQRKNGDELNLGNRTVQNLEYEGPVAEVLTIQNFARLSGEDLHSKKEDSLTIEVPLKSLHGSKISFKYISDPMVLVAFAALNREKMEKAAASLRGTKVKGTGVKSLTNDIASLNSRVNERAQALAAGTVFAEVLKDYRRALRNGEDQLRRDRGQRIRLNPDRYIVLASQLILRSYYDVIGRKKGELSKTIRTVPMRFPSDRAGLTRTLNVTAAHIDKSLDQLFEHAGPIYSGSGARTGRDWFLKEYDRLLKPIVGQRMGGYKEEDAESVRVILQHFIENYLPQEIELLGIENAQNDAEIAKRIKHLRQVEDAKAAAEKKAADNKTASAPKSSVKINPVYAQPGTPPTTVVLSSGATASGYYKPPTP